MISFGGKEKRHACGTRMKWQVKIGVGSFFVLFNLDVTILYHRITLLIGDSDDYRMRMEYMLLVALFSTCFASYMSLASNVVLMSNMSIITKWINGHVQTGYIRKTCSGNLLGAIKSLGVLSRRCRFLVGT